MSVHAIERKRTPGFEVRWRTLAGTNRAQRFKTAEEAAAFDAAIRAKVALERARATWAAVEPRWRRYVDQRPELR